jgi:hypothetical protein
MASSNGELEDQWERNEAADHEVQVVLQRRSLRVDSERPRLGEQRLDSNLRLDPRQGRSNAQMDAPPETDMVPWIGSIESHLIGVFVIRRIAIRSRPHENEVRSGWDQRAIEFDVFFHCPVVTTKWWIEATCFLH